MVHRQDLRAKGSALTRASPRRVDDHRVVDERRFGGTRVQGEGWNEPHGVLHHGPEVQGFLAWERPTPREEAPVMNFSCSVAQHGTGTTLPFMPPETGP